MHRHGPNCLEGPFARTSFVPSKRNDPKGRKNAARRRAGGSAENTSIRWELVERVRREIAEGTYETAEKWEAALEQCLRRLEEGR